MMLGLDSSSENSCSRILDFKYLMLSFVQGSHDGWLGISGRSCPCPLHGLEADPGLRPPTSTASSRTTRVTSGSEL